MKKAFTLAEILITLGIIGVVAALTMPSLIANYEKKRTVVQLKKAYSSIAQAIQLAEVDNGPMEDWDFGEGTNQNLDATAVFAKTYFEPYFKGLTFCSSGLDNPCGSASSAAGYNYTLPDGTGITVVSFGQGGGAHYTDAADTVQIMVDLNSLKGPNRRGRDMFDFALNTKLRRVVPWGYSYNPDFTRDEIMSGYDTPGGQYHYACSKTSDAATPYHLCTWLIMNDSWEIAPDYPW